MTECLFLDRSQSASTPTLRRGMAALSRAADSAQWAYDKLIASPALMTNLGKADRDLLASRVTFESCIVTSHQQSSDGTEKLLLTWPNGANAETVMIPDGPRRTACVSSQVGCPVGCRFCASGINGVKGNLSAAQIVEQIFRLNLMLQTSSARISTSSSWEWRAAGLTMRM